MCILSAQPQYLVPVCNLIGLIRRPVQVGPDHVMNNLICNGQRQPLMVSSTGSLFGSRSHCLVLPIVKNAPNAVAVPIDVITAPAMGHLAYSMQQGDH